ncbi:MAG TPA: hypothetical protein VMU36_06060 [Spirochaetia bacterium]|nr:hypothetical protein [Spirochaetia bacterium]
MNDLEFAEYAKYVDYALSKAGHQKAKSIDDASEAIFLYYGIGNPGPHRYTFWLPGSDTTESSSLTAPDNIIAYGTWGISGVGGDQQNQGSCRYISLSAVDLVKYKEERHVLESWRMEISSTGSSNDLRLVFPVMIAASENYLGQDTRKILYRTLTDEDPQVVDMRAVGVP